MSPRFQGVDVRNILIVSTLYITNFIVEIFLEDWLKKLISPYILENLDLNDDILYLNIYMCKRGLYGTNQTFYHINSETL